ncbi:MAG: PAS domain-containing sensor histidine kinase [Proteobacteria bacterium]|nr:PAS domain-containing sensor histidine kinase [Pseudomonadota bacterium]
MIKKLNIDLNLVINSMPEHVYWLDEENNFIGCNDNQAKALGLTSSEDIIGRNLSEFLSGQNLKCILEINKEVISKGIIKTVEEPFVTVSGNVITVLSKKVPLKDDAGNTCGVLGISFDVSEIKEKEKKLHSEKNQVEIVLRNLMTSFLGHVFWKDKNGVYLGCNLSQAQSLGLKSPEEIIGKTDYDLSDKKYADAYKSVDEKVIKSGESITIEEAAVYHNEKESIFLSKKIPLKDFDGEIIGLLGISFDITAQREAEAREKDALKAVMLAEKQKELMEEQVELFKQLSASVAHELRTPLSAMKMITETMKEWFPDIIQGYQLAREKNLPVREINPQVFDELKEAVKTFDLEIAATFLFINMFLNNIRQEDKINTKSFKQCSIKNCVEEALKRYPFFDSQKEKVLSHIDYDFKFHGDSELFIHVIFNLLKNALYYIAGYDEAKIEIWTSEDKKYNVLHFKDTGEGIEEEVLSHIFERFYSKTYHGTGVGLAYCKMVMEVFGGKIICRSERGKYTEFVLSFPRNC